MKISTLLVSAPLAALIMIALGAPVLPWFAFAAASLLLAQMIQAYARPASCYDDPVAAPHAMASAARLPLAA